MHPHEPQPARPADDPSYQPQPEPAADVGGAAGYWAMPPTHQQAPQPGGGPADLPATGPTNLQVRLSDALVGMGALLVFLFSFAPFISYDDPDMIRRLEESSLPTWFSAWALETFLAPLTWWVIIAALGTLALAGLALVAPGNRELGGFRLDQWRLILAYFGFMVMAGYALSAKTLVFGAELQGEMFSTAPTGNMAFGWGGVLMLLGATVAAVAATLSHLGVDTVVWPLSGPAPAHPPQQAQAQPAQAAQQAHPPQRWGLPPHSAPPAQAGPTGAPPPEPAGPPPA